MSMKNISQISARESLMVLVMVICCPIDQIMGTWVVSGSGQTENRGITLTGILVNRQMKALMIA